MKSGSLKELINKLDDLRDKSFCARSNIFTLKEFYKELPEETKHIFINGAFEHLETIEKIYQEILGDAT